MGKNGRIPAAKPPGSFFPAILETPRYLVDGTVGPAAAGLFLLLPLAAILGKGAWAARGERPAACRLHALARFW